MTDWQLGKKDEARAMLAKGQDLAPIIIPERVANGPEDKFLAWLYARIQLDEANTLIQKRLTDADIVKKQ